MGINVVECSTIRSRTNPKINPRGPVRLSGVEGDSFYVEGTTFTRGRDDVHLWLLADGPIEKGVVSHPGRGEIWSIGSEPIYGYIDDDYAGWVRSNFNLAWSELYSGGYFNFRTDVFDSKIIGHVKKRAPDIRYGERERCSFVAEDVIDARVPNYSVAAMWWDAYDSEFLLRTDFLNIILDVKDVKNGDGKNGVPSKLIVALIVVLVAVMVISDGE